MAKAAYIGANVEVPVYSTQTDTLNSPNKLNTLFNFSGIGSDIEYFTLSSTGVFTSNNAGEYYDDYYEDEETGEEIWETYGYSSWMSWTPQATISSLYFDWKVSSEQNYDCLEICLQREDSSEILVTASGEQSGTIGPLTLGPEDSIDFNYWKDGSTDEGTDTATISNVRCTTTVQTGTEIKQLAKKVNSIYLGINNISKEIVKAYVGVGGVARPWYGWDSTDHYGTTTNLVTARYLLAATSVGNYALFGGGYNHMTGSYNGTTIGEDDWATVDAYDKSLTKANVPDLNVGRSSLAATTIGNYALFVGGYSRDDHENDYNDASYSVDAYNKSLTRTSPTQLAIGTQNCGATAIGDYALFGGGYFVGYKSRVYAYNTSLVQSLPSALSVGRSYVKATTVGNYALFAGGRSSSSAVATVDAYTSTLTLTSVTNLSVARTSPCAITVGNYALFCGGDWSTATCTAVDAYDTALTRISCSNLPTYGMNLAGTTLRDWAIISGGNNVTYDYNYTYQYDSSLVRSSLTKLSTARTNMAATSIGKYALFGGGSVSSNSDKPSNIVDVYTLI